MIEGNDQQPEGVYGDHNQVNKIIQSFGAGFFFMLLAGSVWGVCPQIKMALRNF
jgi:hypothetical protein